MSARCLRVEDGRDNRKTVLVLEQELWVSPSPFLGQAVAWPAAYGLFVLYEMWPTICSYLCELEAAAWTCGEEYWMAV